MVYVGGHKLRWQADNIHELCGLGGDYGSPGLLRWDLLMLSAALLQLAVTMKDLCAHCDQRIQLFKRRWK